MRPSTSIEPAQLRAEKVKKPEGDLEEEQKGRTRRDSNARTEVHC